MNSPPNSFSKPRRLKFKNWASDKISNSFSLRSLHGIGSPKALKIESITFSRRNLLSSFVELGLIYLSNFLAIQLAAFLKRFLLLILHAEGRRSRSSLQITGQSG